MTTFDVMLMNKKTFQGRKVTVQSKNKNEAMKKAINIQPISGLWTALTCKLNDAYAPRFKHKGIAYHIME